MLRPSLSPAALAPLAAALLAGACARPVPPAPPIAGAAWNGRALRDSTTIRRFCVAPDSVLAGRRPCELRDQSPPLRLW